MYLAQRGSARGDRYIMLINVVVTNLVELTGGKGYPLQWLQMDRNLYYNAEALNSVIFHPSERQ
jgi:hypothetical protein